MARSPFSPSPSPPSPSISFSSNSSSDIDPHQQAFFDGPSISRPNSPPGPHNDTVTCQWEGCGTVYGHLPTLSDHIRNDHIGGQRSNYSCEWATCSRRGLPQTSRFALISHVRSHTGEKPFLCPRPECDKSFTRSDALAKHMRLQHNISPPPPGRGGNRKRKREGSVPASNPTQGGPPDSNAAVDPLMPPLANGSPFNTFKVEPHTPPEGELDGDYFTNGHLRHRSVSPVELSGSEGDDGLPEHLLKAQDPQTGLIMGRTPAMVRYLVMKAKHRYALEQHAHLIEELRVARWELKAARELKEGALNEVLRTEFGPQADALIAPVYHYPSLMPPSEEVYQYQ